MLLKRLRLGLWRPVTAFTHWLDCRLFPDSPVLMHVHNIAWLAAIVFLIMVVYRKLIGTGWVAGLAALLFLLDGNTYFPVAFIANRGFMLAAIPAATVMPTSKTSRYPARPGTFHFHDPSPSKQAGLRAIVQNRFTGGPARHISSIPGVRSIEGSV
jgi:hypothetical protein